MPIYLSVLHILNKLTNLHFNEASYMYILSFKFQLKSKILKTSNEGYNIFFKLSRKQTRFP